MTLAEHLRDLLHRDVHVIYAADLGVDGLHRNPSLSGPLGGEPVIGGGYRHQHLVIQEAEGAARALALQHAYNLELAPVDANRLAAPGNAPPAGSSHPGSRSRANISA